MAEAGDNAVAPIIKKKKIVKGDGHHGGAWKVAIAFPYSSGAFAPISLTPHDEAIPKLSF